MLLSLPMSAEAQSAKAAGAFAYVSASGAEAPVAQPAPKQRLAGKKKKKSHARKSKKAKPAEEIAVSNAVTPAQESHVKGVLGHELKHLSQLAPAAGFSDVWNWFKEDPIEPSAIPVDPNATLEGSPPATSFEAPPAQEQSQQNSEAPIVPAPRAIPPAPVPEPPSAVPPSPLPPPVAATPATPPDAPLVVRDPVDATLDKPLSESPSDVPKENLLFQGENLPVPEKKPEPVFLDLPPTMKAQEPSPPPVDVTTPAPVLAPAPASQPTMLPPVDVTSEAPSSLPPSPLPAAAPLSTPPVPELPASPPPSGPVSLVPLPPMNDIPPEPVVVPAAPSSEPVRGEMGMEPTLPPVSPTEAPVAPPVIAAPSEPPPPSPPPAPEKSMGDEVLDFFSRNLGLSEDTPPPPPSPPPAPVPPPSGMPDTLPTPPPAPVTPPAGLPETLPTPPPVVDSSKAAPVAPVITSGQPFANPAASPDAPAQPGASKDLPLPPPAINVPASEPTPPSPPPAEPEKKPEAKNAPEEGKAAPPPKIVSSPIIKRKREKIKNLDQPEGDTSSVPFSPMEGPVPLVTAIGPNDALPLPSNEGEPKKGKKAKRSKETTPPPRLIEEVIPPEQMGTPPRMLGESSDRTLSEKVSPESRRIISNIPSGLDREKIPKGKSHKVDHAREVGDLFPEDDKTDAVHARGIDIKVKRQDTDVNMDLERAYDATMAGRAEEAAELYQEVLAYEPSNKQALLGLATTYHRAGDLKRARPLYGRLIELDPQNREAVINFMGLLAEEDSAEALFQLEKLEDVNPNFAPIPAQMAMINQKNGDLESAKKQMIRATVLAPENMTYRYNLAVLLDRMGDWRGAAKLYQQIINASERGEKIPAERREIQERLTFIMSNKSMQ